ncbi:NYN domain-containing protein [Caenibacillus caldisaponilyticus]|jgi:predicted RNA-binding protein with PIN domain|uniref:NYN domain-containing protein n=1 Tax=Caenibacillus caldisaponilyticus TaxID=1674942 RepID=UPI0009883110|nr:NYN domain-containing protein [Caenibacillus caldisaponilyticus]
MVVLLVDAYNIIGAWPELKRLKAIDLAAARDRLIDDMAEFQAYTGWRVILVFDAHFVPGAETRLKQSQVEIIYTRENETADEKIEKFVSELKDVRTTIYVATSDSIEQWTVFSKGALRKPARELYRDMEQIKKRISTIIQEYRQQNRRTTVALDDKLTALFENWRRGK